MLLLSFSHPPDTRLRIIPRAVHRGEAEEQRPGGQGGQGEGHARGMARLEARREAQLSLATTGTVDKMLVREGDKVEAGDVLVQLNTAALKRAVANAHYLQATETARLTLVTCWAPWSIVPERR